MHNVIVGNVLRGRAARGLRPCLGLPRFQREEIFRVASLVHQRATVRLLGGGLSNGPRCVKLFYFLFFFAKFNRRVLNTHERMCCDSLRFAFMLPDRPLLPSCLSNSPTLTLFVMKLVRSGLDCGTAWCVYTPSY